MIGVIEGFDWDDGNRSKCQQHGVSIGEIEALFNDTIHVFPDARHSAEETRFLAIGKTQTGRHVFLAFTVRLRGGGRFIRPISARYMHAKEVAHYETQIAKTQD